MHKHYSAIDANHQDFIEQQRVFFVGTAAADGRVSVSPKGQDSLRACSTLTAWPG
jgi:predicted pyridoxine 5'-phosphate oxidase superfamily flavin-nucleotide-binding protein